MPDYDLGRAHGEVIITADTSGAEKATAAMAATDAEAKALNRTLGDTNKNLTAHEQSMKRTAETTKGYQQRVKELTDAEDRLRKTLLDSKSTSEEIGRARRDQATAARNLESAEQALRTEAEKSASSFQKLLTGMMNFGKGTSDSRRHVQGLTSDLRSATDAADKLANTLTKTLGTALKVVGGGAGVGIAGGALGLLGAGGASGGMNVLAGVVETVKDFSGAVALLPALVGAAGVSVATLAVSLHGVGDALKAMDDPTAFAKALVNMAPAAQQAMRTIASFSNAYKSAGKEVQQAFFQPMLDSIKPLILTWLPQLMNAGKAVGGAFGSIGRTIMQTFLQPENIKGFQTFITNLTASIKSLEPAIKPIMQAFATLGVVGSQSFGRLAETVNKIANSFNQFIQKSAASGQLTAWINRALDAFSSLWDIMKNVGQALNNIMAIGDKFGGNFLNILVRITSEFDNWTKSTKGQQTLSAFFSAIQQAGQALSPVIKTIGADFVILFTALAKLGTSMAPGLEVFFTGLGQAFKTLGDAFSGSSTSFTVILSGLGSTLAQLAGSIGPKLPEIFTNLATAFIDLVPAVVTVAGAIAGFMSHVTAGDIELVLGLVGAIKVAVPIFTVLNAVMSANPIALVISALAALTVGVIYAYDHFKTFHDIVDNVFTVIKELVTGIGPALGDLGNAVSSAFSSMINNAEDWGKNLVTNFIAGIKSMFGPVGDAVGSVAQIVNDFWQHKSPPKAGPLHDAGGAQQMGATATEFFAQGIESTSSQVDSATSAVAAQAAKGYGGISGVASSLGGSFLSPGTGAGGGAFTSGGQRQVNGSGTPQGVGGVGGGQSGFDQYIAGLTTDLSALGKIAQDSFHLFQDVANIGIQAAKITASLWNQGDNPLTQPGGFFNTPGQGPVAPLPELTPQHYAPGNTPAVGQEAVPGVPQLGPNIPAPQVQGQSPPTGVGQQNAGAPQAGDTALVAALKANGSFSPEQIRMIQGFSQVEGNNPAGNPTLGFTDSQLGGATDLPSHVTALAQQFKDRAPVAGAFPAGGTNQQQAEWIAKIVGQNGSPSDWQGNAQPKDYVQRVAGAMQGLPAPGGSSFAGVTGGTQGQAPAGVSGPGLRPNLNINGAKGLQPGAQNALQAISSLFPQVTSVGGVRDDSLPYHPEGRALDVMLPKDLVNTPQGVDLGDKIVQYFQQNAGALGISDSIFNRQYYQPGQPTVPFQYQGTDPDQAHETHVHLTFQPGFTPQGPPPGIASPNAVGRQGAFGPQQASAPATISPSGLPVAAGATVVGGPLVATSAIRMRRRLARQAAAAPKPGESIGGLTIDASDPAATAPDMVDVFHATDDAGAEGISKEGFRQTGALPDAYFSRDLEMATKMSENYGLPRIMHGQVPSELLRPDNMTLGVRAPYSGIAGMPFRELSAEELASGVVKPPATVAGDAAAATDSVAGADAGSSALGRAGRLAGRALTPLAMLPFALGAARNISGNQRVQGGTATWGDLLSGRGSTASINNSPLESRIDQNDPNTRFPRGVNAGQTSTPGVQGIPQSTIDLAAKSGHPIPGTTPSPGVTGSLSSPNVGLTGTGKPIDVNVAQQGGKSAPDPTNPNGAIAGAQRYGPSLPQNPANEPTAKPTGVSVPGEVRAGPTLPNNAVAEPTAVGASQPTENAQSPTQSVSQANQLGSALTSAGSIAGDAFQVFDDVVKSIGAAANITDQMVRGFANTEDVVKFVQQAQQFITTAADIAKLVSDTAGTVGQFVGAGAAADPSGSTAGVAAAFGAVSAISGLVGQVLQAVNASISLGIEVYHEATKIQANIEGFTLGNAQTGQLAGNVQMLLNTQTGQVSAYSDSNPLNKAVHNLPSWFANSYGGNRPATTVMNNNQLVQYVGPGQSPMQMMSESMWMVGTGAPSVASVAGRD